MEPLDFKIALLILSLFSFTELSQVPNKIENFCRETQNMLVLKVCHRGSTNPELHLSQGLKLLFFPF